MSQFSANDLEILISTENRNNLEFLFKMFPNDLWKNISILIVNQTKKENLVSQFQNVRVINSSEKGLSKSRNLALKNAQGKLLLIADDDLVYHDDFVVNIVTGFNELVTDFVCFQYVENGKIIKKYPQKSQKKLSIIQLLHIISFEVAFKKDVLDKNQIYFDKRFGINAPFFMGEENTFLLDYYKKGCSFGFYPKIIVSHNQPTTNDKLSENQRYFSAGAFFYRNFPRNNFYWIFSKLFFDLKQGKIKWKNVIKLYKQAIKGKNQLKNEKKNK